MQGRKCKRNCCRKRGEVEFFGIILLVVGLVTICSFLLPCKLWLVILGVTMIFCGFKLFIG